MEFWDACAEKGVGVVLSSAASTFPHSYLPLTSICYSLASNTASCDRLVQFASSLSLFTSEVRFVTFLYILGVFCNVLYVAVKSIFDLIIDHVYRIDYGL